MKILDEIKKRLQVWHEQRAASIEYKRQTQLDAEAREVVQIMEFNGRVYVSVNGIPMFDIDDVSGSMIDIVTKARQNYKDWREEKLWEKTGTTQGFIPC
ncbi:hypothetical protein CUB95_01605 [Prevotella intermedia]|uniref:hypothetical protein n=1 Tax=Prevotella intermedia TaxID=28131 RepID=UPI000C1C1B33|nr:hypothetical protein [Prevotella intermedia]ATV37350.1 hypothetical protein CUB95_01605 [Prevotella intermedia]